jgi:hypothetical protein
LPGLLRQEKTFPQRNRNGQSRRCATPTRTASARYRFPRSLDHAHRHASKKYDLTYSKFIAALGKGNCQAGPKVLSNLAVYEAGIFEQYRQFRQEAACLRNPVSGADGRRLLRPVEYRKNGKDRLLVAVLVFCRT